MATCSHCTVFIHHLSTKFCHQVTLPVETGPSFIFSSRVLMFIPLVQALILLEMPCRGSEYLYQEPVALERVEWKTYVKQMSDSLSTTITDTFTFNKCNILAFSSISTLLIDITLLLHRLVCNEHLNKLPTSALRKIKDLMSTLFVRYLRKYSSWPVSNYLCPRKEVIMSPGSYVHVH